MTSEQNTTNWSLKDVIFVLGGFFAINALFLLFVEVDEIQNAFNLPVFENKTLNGVVLYVFSALAFLAPLYLFAVRGRKITFGNFGIKKLSISDAIKTVLTGYGLLLLLTVVVALIMHFIGEIPGIGSQKSILPIFGEGRIATIVMAVIAVGVAPIVEEIFFRGFLLRSLMGRFSFFTSTVVTSAIFAFVHFQFESILGIFILSLIINYLYKINRGSTTATIVFHMVNNAVALIVLFTLTA